MMVTGQKTAEAAALAKQKVAAAAGDRGVQVGVASAVGGGLVVGAGGAATGCAAGGAVGAAVGLLPALFTFGLSIPIGAFIGAGCGTVAGGAIGGTVGFTGAGAAGYGAYTKRANIKNALAVARAKLRAALDRTQNASKSLASKTKKKVVDSCQAGCQAVKGHMVDHYMKAREMVTPVVKSGKDNILKVLTNKEVQGTAASATGGAVALGTCGAAAGTVAGGTLGAAAGLLPALFTFGLSIPFFAVVGGGCGLLAGSTLGGATGVVAGAGGYQTFTRRAALKAFVARKAQQGRAGFDRLSQRALGKEGKQM